ncbi:MAG: Hsp20/alpha crystallin family protein [Myxococcota bacterium]|jgi:HSP20 family protein
MARKNDKSRGAGGLLGGLSDLIENLQNTPAGKKADKGDDDQKTRGAGSFQRILEGPSEIGDKLSELSEKSEGINKTGEFTLPGKEGGIKGVYGFSFKTGISNGEEKIKVEPFGNVRHDKKTGRATVQEIREPMMDVFEEDDGTLLVLEMPGISKGDIKIDVKDDVLTMSAEKGEKKYRKEVLLKHQPAGDRVTVTCNNGVVQIKCPR